MAGSETGSSTRHPSHADQHPAQGRRRAQAPPAAAPARATEKRIAVLTAGRAIGRIELADTATADLVWQALPLHSTAETWGASIHFETPLEAGRDRTARINAARRDLFLGRGRPHPRAVRPDADLAPGRMPPAAPCNVWARALDDVKALAMVTPGEKVSLVAA